MNYYDPRKTGVSIVRLSEQVFKERVLCSSKAGGELAAGTSREAEAGRDVFIDQGRGKDNESIG